MTDQPVPNAQGVTLGELLHKSQGEVGVRQGYDPSKARKVAMEPTSKPICPWCKQASLSVRHNKSQGDGRIFCTNCSYDDSQTGSNNQRAEPGQRGVKITSRTGPGDSQSHRTGVKIISGNRIGG